MVRRADAGDADEVTRVDPPAVAVAAPPARDLEPQTLGSLAPDEDDGPVDPTGAYAPAPDGERYELGEVIGRGGMGEVRVARDSRVGRDVAVKLLRMDRSKQPPIKRFLREARVQGRLEHPSIVPVHDLGVDADGRPYFVMKRLTGATLQEIFDAREQGLALGARWGRRLLLARLVGVCQAVAFAHRRGVVHRDLKPGNIVLGEYGEAHVLDWGVARVLGEDVPAVTRHEEFHREDLDSVEGSRDTAAGAVLGTPGYMAPEQLRGDDVDGRADVYALGCILFEVLAGEPALPRGGAAYEATLSAVAHRPRQRAPGAEVPPELDDLCARATAPEPAERLPGAEALAEGIQRYLDGDRDLIRRQELASQHAAAARALLGEPGAAARATAMSEAGRALALDPSHREAQALIGRLLLEPPREIPTEVAVRVAAARTHGAQVQLGAAARTYLAYLLIVPTFLVGAVHAPLVVALMGALLLGNAALTARLSRRRGALGRWVYAALALHGVLLAVNAVIFSPFLVVPAFAVTSVSAFGAHPTLIRPLAVVGVHVAAVVGPLAAELAGLLPRTFSTAGDTLSITPWAVVVPASQLIWVVMLLSVTQLIGASVLVVQLRRAEDEAREGVHLNAWHLEQLLP